MLKRLLNTRIKIEIVEKKLSDDNLWILEHKLWREVWASISLKDISSRRVLYLFTVKWKCDFPREFRVIVKDKIFTPTQFPIMEPSQDLILFHAIINNFSCDEHRKEAI
ncbi:MAG: hypothetical protein LBB25_04625 [Holosporaceae bacterium]|jgi:hypothetical protein|nr:hypothetical protein [Holosporaceae bacterium]